MLVDKGVDITKALNYKKRDEQRVWCLLLTTCATLDVHVMLDNHVERKLEHNETPKGGGGGGGLPVTRILHLFLRN